MELGELFESYLCGKMSESDKVLFEKLLNENPEYQSQLTAYQQQKARSVPQKTAEELPSKAKNIKNWIISIAIAVGIVLAGYFLFNMLSISTGEKLYKKHYETYPNQVPSSVFREDEFGLKSDAFQAYNEGNYKRAAELLEQVQTQPDSDFALLYLGICQLELGRPEKAIPVLGLIPANSKTASKEVASWFEAMGYFKLNMLEKGKKSLQITAAKPNPFQTQAKTILESLE